MTVSRINMESVHHFIGHSGDIKPTTGAGAGSKFTELDTGATYIWNNGTWEIDLRLFWAISKAIELS